MSIMDDGTQTSREVSIATTGSFQDTYFYDRSHGSTFQLGDMTQLQKTYAVITYITCFSGMISNVFVFIIACTISELKKHKDFIFITNQIIIDFYTTFIALFSYILLSKVPFPSGISGDFYCRIVWSETLVHIGFYASVFNMILIALDRMYMVVYPLKHRVSFSKNKALISVSITWAIAIVINIPNCLMYPLKGNYCIFVPLSESVKATQSWNYFLALITYFIPLVLLISIYLYLFYKIGKRKQLVFAENILGAQGIGIPSSQISGTAQQSTPPNALSKPQIKLIKAMITLTICFLICWSPMQVYNFLYTIGLPLGYLDAIYITSLCMCVLNSTLNPFIYWRKYPHFRKHSFSFKCSQN